MRVRCCSEPQGASPEVAGVEDSDEPLFGFLLLSVFSVQPLAEIYLVRNIGSDVMLESTLLQLFYARTINFNDLL